MGCEKIINLQQEGGENILNLEREMNVGGAVKSVNGMTGDVVLTTSDLENTSDYQTGSEVESAISTAVGAEATIRANADTALGGRIDNLVTGLGNEITARQTADNSLQGQIDAITASSDVTDIVGTKAQLNNYDTSKLNDNDIIKVLQDESQNDETTYYRWSTTTQSFTLIGEEGPYYTKAESNVLLQGKQDVLTAGTNINITNNVISATDTTYSAGNAITIDANNEISADIYPADYFTAGASMTETGTTVQFDDTLPANMSFDNLYGDSEQQTYTGKNLVDALNVTWTRFNSTLTKTDGVFEMVASSEKLARCCLPVSGLVEGTTYTFSCDIHGVSISSILNTSYLRVRETSSGGSWVSEASYITQTSDYVRVSITFTATSVSNPYVWFYISASPSNTNNIEIYAKNLQFEAGSATDYEPYVGGIPAPNPEYPQDVHTVTGEQTVTVTGKNLFDKSNVALGKNWGGAIGTVCYPFQNSQNRAVVLIPVKPNTTYNLKLYSSEWYMLERNEVDSSYVVVARNQNVNQNEVTATITTTAQTNYIGAKFKYGSAGTTVFTPDLLNELKMQLEVGSTATTFEPYQSQSYTIDLGTIELCKIGDYQDYIYKSGDNWYVHKDCGKIEFDGSNDETWSIVGSGTANFFYAYNSIPNYFYSGLAQGFICSAGVGASIGSSTTDKGVSITNVAEFRIRYGTEMTLENWKSYLSSTPMSVYYRLATPTDTQITDANLISQLNTLDTVHSYNGETNIVISATGTNLPAISKVTAIKNSASGIVKELENVVTSAELDSRLGGLTLLPISQTDYDALSTKDPNTLYVITGA